MSNYTNIADSKLISLYKKTEDKEIIGELYKRYTQFVFLVSMKYLKNEDESNDSVMQIFEKLFSDLIQHNVSNFKSWLFMVTRNHCLMKLRKNQKTLKNQQELKKDSEDFMENDMNSHLSYEEEDINKIKTVQDALNQLKTEQKECVSLFYLEGKSYSEIEDITDYSLKNIKSYIQNGKRNLKNILQKAGISAIYLLTLFNL